MGLQTTKEIEQIDRLRIDLGLPPPCSCMELDAHDRNHYLLGYCQGLFNVEGDSPSSHTTNVSRLLTEAEAPMPNSHELFIGLKPEQLSISRYLSQAMMPLRENGRVPIIITHYDPSTDLDAIHEIISAKSSMDNSDTIFVRVQLQSPASIAATAALLQKMYQSSVDNQSLPDYWPLIQANNFSIADWEFLRKSVGEKLWRYVAIAATPFMSKDVLQLVADNIAVVQFFVGEANGISADGVIAVPSQSCVGGPEKLKQYNLHEYIKNLRATRGMNAVVGIICGQSQGWSQEENIARVKKYVYALKSVVGILWGDQVGRKIQSYYANMTPM
jgi:hypothetical protein